MMSVFLAPTLIGEIAAVVRTVARINVVLAVCVLSLEFLLFLFLLVYCPLYLYHLTLKLLRHILHLDFHVFLKLEFAQHKIQVNTCQFCICLQVRLFVLEILHVHNDLLTRNFTEFLLEFCHHILQILTSQNRLCMHAFLSRYQNYFLVRIEFLLEIAQVIVHLLEFLVMVNYVCCLWQLLYFSFFQFINPELHSKICQKLFTVLFYFLVFQHDQVYVPELNLPFIFVIRILFQFWTKVSHQHFAPRLRSPFTDFDLFVHWLCELFVSEKKTWLRVGRQLTCIEVSDNFMNVMFGD